MRGPARGTGILRERGRFSPFARRFLLPAQAFIHTAGTGGLLLLAAAVAALLWANSPWGDAYGALWETTLSLDLGILSLEEPFRETVNSGLMTLFFFLMGLEVKRELLEGELSEPRKAMLPAVAAVGGMLVPIGLYLLLNPTGETRSGWGVPMATDIAFALAVLALLGDRIRDELRTVLLTIAVADDVGSILVIAVFYAGDLSLPALAAAAGLVALILGLRRVGVRSGLAYGIVGLALWLAVHASGVHATIAGVALGLLTPIASPYGLQNVRERVEPLLERLERARNAGRQEEAEVVLGRMTELLEDTESPLDRMHRLVLPWTSFLVLPLFALANAGIEITGSALAEAARSPAAQGIVLGLVGGKLLGILGFAWMAVRLGLADRLPGVRFRDLAGLGLVAGIGFTVSIFIADLAFPERLLESAKLAILAASLLAGGAGYAVLRLASRGLSSSTEGPEAG